MKSPVKYIKMQLKSDIPRRVFEILLLQFKEKIVSDFSLPVSSLRKMKHPQFYLARTMTLLQKIQACEVSRTSDSFFSGSGKQFD